MKHLLRILAGLVFLASGFVKAVDPVGFSFKLEEYFSPSVFNLPQLEVLSLPLAIFISGVEVLLGLCILMRFFLRPALAAAIALCVFFAFLTFYSAYYNVVTDCGCFGDAIKFTPWQSFIKDIVLLAVLVALWYFYRNDFRSELHSKQKSAVLGVGVLALIFIIYKGITGEPLIDFRDYKVGTNLNQEKLKIAKDPAVYQTIYHLKNNRTGAQETLSQDEYLADNAYWREGSEWQIESGKTTTEKVSEGYSSEISKFRLEDEAGKDITNEILNAENVVLLFSYKPGALTSEEILAAEKAVRGNPLVYGVSTANRTFSTIRNLTMDGTAIKTIGRSNPFILVLNKGKIIEKKPAKDF